MWFWTSFSYLLSSLPSHFLPPSVLLPPFLHHISHLSSSCPHLSMCAFYFYKDIYSQDDILPAIACWLVLQYFPPVVGQSGSAPACQINMDLRRRFIMKTVIFFFFTRRWRRTSSSPPSPAPASSARVKKDVALQEERKTERRRAWRRSSSVCSTWYFSSL